MKNSKVFSRFGAIVVTITLVLVSSSSTAQTHVTDKANAEFVEMMVKELRTELPMDIGGGMFFTAVYIANSNLVAECTCPDSVVDLLRLGFSQVSKEDAIKGCFEDPEMKLIGRICAEANYGIRFIYLTSSRTNQTEMFFTTSDLKRFLPSTNQ